VWIWTVSERQTDGQKKKKGNDKMTKTITRSVFVPRHPQNNTIEEYEMENARRTHGRVEKCKQNFNLIYVYIKAELC
jgi:hypothetical protein